MEATKSAMKESIVEGLKYDAWATEQWYEALGRFRDTARASEVLAHILGARSVWLKRCKGEEPDYSPAAPSRDRILDENGDWMSYLAEADLDELIHYRNRAGEPHSSSVKEIAQHVINHGTYHRGHLRGLAEAEGLEDFPETDWIAYTRR